MDQGCGHCYQRKEIDDVSSFELTHYSNDYEYTLSKLRKDEEVE